MLSNWRGGFAAAAVAVITTFFANDSEFADKAKWEAFAGAMVNKNRFLFSNNKGLNNKVGHPHSQFVLHPLTDHLNQAWSGLWRSPFLLQTFTHHYNYTQGHVEVAGLPSGFQGYGAQGALALACATVRCHYPIFTTLETDCF